VSIERFGHVIAPGEGPATTGGMRLRAVPVVPTADPEELGPDAEEFVRYCFRRRRVSWPELYDEMCGVAARGDFRGMCYEQLEQIGIGFSLGSLPRLARLTHRVAIEERAASGAVPAALSA
jgi:hypothetical protein